MRQSHKTILIWAILILMFVSIYSMFTDSSSKEKEVDANQFHAMLANKDDVAKMEKISIEERGRNSAKYTISMRNDSTKKVVYAELTPELMKEIVSSGVVYNGPKTKEESSVWPQVLVWWLPMLLLVGIFFLFMRQLQSGGGKAMSFGKSKAKLLS
ncbi:MAG TPA: ATP-dependent metallopeptidase FtsH/Yme1/Tma family protein, partial [Kofleriaceae bacterium]|nr:ATP-dependent metallopeptidase FtsH/Yme1/Tma family protein [Kofleriaceae bacterium]